MRFRQLLAAPRPNIAPCPGGMQSSQRLPWAAAVACCGKAVGKARTGGPGGIKDLSNRLEREDTRVAAGLTPPKGDAGHAQSERQSYLCRLPHPATRGRPRAAGKAARDGLARLRPGTSPPTSTVCLGRWPACRQLSPALPPGGRPQAGCQAAISNLVVLRPDLIRLPCGGACRGGGECQAQRFRKAALRRARLPGGGKLALR